MLKKAVLPASNCPRGVSEVGGVLIKFHKGVQRILQLVAHGARYGRFAVVVVYEPLARGHEWMYLAAGDLKPWRTLLWIGHGEFQI